MRLLQRLADVNDPSSLSNRLRSKRFQLFARLTEPLPRPLRIRDLGGTPEFWDQRGWADREDVLITTVNLRPGISRHAGIRSIPGDVTDLGRLADNSFDIAFSNSVIEHLYTFERQAAMAREIQRVAPAFWLQTPNYWFPIEPHFHVLGWQWMPVVLRKTLIRRVQCGWRGPVADDQAAGKVVREVRLMTHRQLRRLFPQATIVAERFGGLVKSWISYAGFGDGAENRGAA